MHLIEQSIFVKSAIELIRFNALFETLAHFRVVADIIEMKVWYDVLHIISHLSQCCMPFRTGTINWLR